MPYQIIALAGKLYHPSNGTEGMIFESEFCDNCERDRAYFESEGNKPGCGIHARALVFDPRESEYPIEWIHTVEGIPTCTAFTEYAEPLRDATGDIIKYGFDAANNFDLFEPE